MNAPATDLVLPGNAVVALRADARREQFAALAGESKDITAISNPAGYTQCHAARMKLKTARVELEKEAKGVREGAVRFQKDVIALEQSLCALILPEESRLATLQTEFDAAKERLRQAEADRIAGIKQAIVDLNAIVPSMAGKSSAAITLRIDALKAYDVSEWAAEFKVDAERAHGQALAALQQLHAGAVAQEETAAAEAKRIAEERAELAKLRKEADERAKVDRAAAEAKRIELETARIRAEEVEKLQREQERKEQAERERIEREQRKAEQDRQENARIQQAGIERAAMAKETAATQVPVSGTEGRSDSRPPAPAATRTRPSRGAIISAVSNVFGVSEETAHGWIVTEFAQETA